MAALAADPFFPPFFLGIDRPLRRRYGGLLLVVLFFSLATER